MATMLETLRAKRENGEISTSSAAVKIAGEGHYTVKVTEAKWDKNRDGTAEQGKITFKVIAVRKDTDPSEVGGIFSEYVSLKNEEMAEKKYLQISDWMANAGIKDEKMVDEDDEDLNDSMRTLILALQKYCQKREITVDCYRKQSDKVDSKGRPYFNNYFDDPFSSEGGEETAEAADEETAKAEPAKAVKAEAPKTSKPGTSPYKTKAAKHEVEDED